MSIAALALLPFLMTAQVQELHPNLQRRVEAGETLRTPGEGEGDVVTCRRERVVGSNRSQRVCTTEAVNARRRQAIQRDLDRRLDWNRNDDGSHHYFPTNRVSGN